MTKFIEVERQYAVFDPHSSDALIATLLAVDTILYEGKAHDDSTAALAQRVVQRHLTLLGEPSATARTEAAAIR